MEGISWMRSLLTPQNVLTCISLLAVLYSVPTLVLQRIKLKKAFAHSNRTVLKNAVSHVLENIPSYKSALDELVSLHDQIGTLTEQNRKHMEELKENEQVKIEERLKKAEQEIADLSQENTRLLKVIEETQAAMQKAQNELADFDEEKRTNEEVQELLHKTIADLQGEKGRLLKSNEDAQKEKEVLSEIIEKLKSELEQPAVTPLQTFPISPYVIYLSSKSKHSE
jgi:chromosome segregation ATPase